ELLSGPDGAPLTRTSLWFLEGVSERDGRVHYRFLVPNGERYELVLEPRNDDAQRDAQTTGFNVTLVPVGTGSRRLSTPLLFSLVPIVSRNDDGRLRLN